MDLSRALLRASQVQSQDSFEKQSLEPATRCASGFFQTGFWERDVMRREAAVVTIGVLQAGTKENVIPDEAIIKLNVRTFNEGVRKLVLAAIERIANAEAEASGAPRKPEITPLDH
jgi:hippurate hydrolase